MNQAAKKISRMKRVLFALIPAFVLLVLATFALERLERGQVIQTVRLDDRVSLPPVNLLSRVQTERGEQFMVRDDSMLKTRFPVEKTDRTFRILIVGGSFMLGSPYVHQQQAPPTQYGIPDWVRAELKLRYPTMNFEVINAAAGAQNSTRVKHIVRQMMEVQPDLVVVATGNNEGAVASSRVNEMLHQWIVYRALKKGVLPKIKPGDRPYYTPQLLSLGDQMELYENNLRQIIQTVQAGGAPLVLCTLPINLKFVPEARVFAKVIPDPSKDPDLLAGNALCENGRYAEAMERFAATSNQVFAVFSMGRCFERQGNFKEAKEAYQIYAEQMPTNRALPSFNTFIRSMGKQKGVQVADLELRLEAISENEIADPKWFYDNCHMTWQGYYEMAQVILAKIETSKAFVALHLKPLPKPKRKVIIRKAIWRFPPVLH
jgi:hypothetical protein